MLTTILTIAVIVLLAAGGMYVYAQSLPDRFQVSRSAVIKAPSEKLYPLINDLRSFNDWNPFAKKDPNAKIAYSGPAEGKGARYDWDGNRQAGKGTLEILDTVPQAKVTMLLHMLKPMEGKNTITFSLAPKADANEVTWAMTGESPRGFCKVMSIFFNMDKMVGGEFEKGLNELKRRAETSAV